MAMGEGRPALTRAPAATRSDIRKAATSAAIMAAAERNFLRTGFHGTTVEDIATDADVATGSIYVHFGSKEGLYLALLQRALDVEESYLATAFDPQIDPAQQLIACGEAYLRFYVENPAYFRILAFPMMDTRPRGKPDPAAVRLAELAEAQVARLARTIDEAVKQGLVREVDPHRAAKFMWGAWAGVISLNLRPDRLRIKDEELASVLATGREMIAWGLAAVRPAERPARARRARTKR
ncbi:MAG: TetR/AcrR family transcriptional regulator [Actinomycetota bacterium]